MKNHFDHIKDYDAEIPGHMRKYFASKKTDFILKEIEKEFGKKSLSILDAGCGTGWHCKILSDKGHKVFGIDSSKNQIQQSKKNSVHSSFVIGDILAIPFKDNSFDVTYTINTVHHLSSNEDQKKALKEIKRVTKKNGIVIIHEMNTQNPIIKFYLNYIFPRLRSIDEGHEHWISPHLWKKNYRKNLKNLEYYTFIPDFTPKTFLPIFRLIEKVLLKTPIKSWSAHYMVVLKNSKT